MTSRSEVVFMLEEASMKAFLTVLLPRLFPALVFRLIAHQGKSDLEKSLPRKLRAWQNPAARFVVVRDQDAGECTAVKQRLVTIARDAGKADVIVRIACRELESWLLGDLPAVATAYDRPKLKALSNKQRYRNPDKLSSPSALLKDLLGGYQKTSGARRIAEHIERERNQSHSFRVFMDAVQALTPTVEG